MIARFLLTFALLAAFLRAADAPRMEVSLSLRRNLTGDYIVVVRNFGTKPVFYGGYGASDAAPPIFGVEILKDGVWKSASIGWCGTGLGESSLREKAELVQPIHPAISFEIQPGERFRVYISFAGESYVAERKRAATPIYSNPIAFIPSVEKRANKAPEPTPMSVTSRAPSSTSRASHGRGSS